MLRRPVLISSFAKQRLHQPDDRLEGVRRVGSAYRALQHQHCLLRRWTGISRLLSLSLSGVLTLSSTDRNLLPLLFPIHDVHSRRSYLGPRLVGLPRRHHVEGVPGRRYPRPIKYSSRSSWKIGLRWSQVRPSFLSFLLPRPETDFRSSSSSCFFSFLPLSWEGFASDPYLSGVAVRTSVEAFQKNNVHGHVKVRFLRLRSPLSVTDRSPLDTQHFYGNEQVRRRTSTWRNGC